MTSVYAAGKAALRSMARSLAGELLPRGIRVNAVSPGPVDTGILENGMTAETAAQFKAQVVAGNPVQRFGTPDEIARAAVFLAFDGHRARFGNGQRVLVLTKGHRLPSPSLR